MRVLIAADQPLFQEGLINLLHAHDYEVAGVAENGMDAFKLTKHLRPDVVMMDIFMPQCDGLEAAMLINANFPEVKIIILTSSENEDQMFSAIKAGACACLGKDFTSCELFGILQSLSKDEFTISQELARRILREEAHNQAETGDRYDLTVCQKKVLDLVSQGDCCRNIAAKLGITESKVKHHFKSILDKVHGQNRMQLVHYIANSNLTDI